MNLRSCFGAPWPDVDVTDLVEHTGEVEPGCAFFAVADDRRVAAQHAIQARALGAQVIASQHDLEDAVQIADLDAVRGQLAARFYEAPASSMECIAVTGTNGKTSVAWFIAGLSEALGVACGYIGTLGFGRVQEIELGEMTTPNPVACQRLLAQLRNQGCRRVVMEVSSHALDQGRVATVPYRAAVFTNLSRDHLDYHGSMEAYGAAKQLLFTDFPIVTAVLNVADAYSQSIAAATQARVIYFGREADDCQWRWRQDGEQVVWQCPTGEYRANPRMAADFALDNLTAALAVLLSAGDEMSHDAAEELFAAVNAVPQVPGRMEVIDVDQAHGTVVVDYAHTPDALAKALAALRSGCRGQLICVVGCGGDRDRGKRPQMAEAAVKQADQVWFTSDNPRTEAPEQILADMTAELSADASHIHINVDRRAAIKAALMGAEEQDVVLIAGKGHENYQEVAGQKLPFDDRLVARSVLAEI